MEIGDPRRNDAGACQMAGYQATDEWKAIKTAEILIPQYIVRIESTATP